MKKSHAKWLHNVELEYCSNQVNKGNLNNNGYNSDIALDSDEFRSFLSNRLAIDKIPVKINRTIYQYTPTGKKMQLELDIREKDGEFSIYTLEFFKNIKELKEFVRRNKLVLEE